jgi:hypothetical protein
MQLIGSVPVGYVKLGLGPIAIRSSICRDGAGPMANVEIYNPSFPMMSPENEVITSLGS